MAKGSLFTTWRNIKRDDKIKSKCERWDLNPRMPAQLDLKSNSFGRLDTLAWGHFKYPLGYFKLTHCLVVRKLSRHKSGSFILNILSCNPSSNQYRSNILYSVSLLATGRPSFLATCTNSSILLLWKGTPAALTTFSSIIVPPRSFAP